MFTVVDHATQSQISTAISAGGFSFLAYSVVGADSSYGAASVTVLLLNATKDGGTSYRTAVASIEAGKLYVKSLASANSSKFYAATVDDGNGIQYTLAQVEAWT